MNIVEISRRRDQGEPTSMTNLADQIVSGLNRAGWDLGVSGFARASGSNCWIVFGTRGQESLHAEGDTPTEALLKAARLAAAG
jgi:hypothetical protein